MRTSPQVLLNEVKAEPQRRRHDPIPAVGQWLRSDVGRHTRYYGVPMNSSTHLEPKGVERRAVHGHPVVTGMSPDIRAQPLSHCGDWIVPASLRLGFHL